MPKLKGHAAAHFAASARQTFRASSVASAETDRVAVIRECLRELHGVELIYAIRCPDGTIKIGWTKNISERRRPLTTDHDAILAVRLGTYEDEQAIHDQLAEHVAHGREYYHPTPDVLGVVNGMRAALGVPAVS